MPKVLKGRKHKGKAIEQPVSILEALPTELFHHILRVSRGDVVLNLKLTCRRLYLKSKFSDGSEVVKKNSGINYRLYVNNMIRLEASGPRGHKPSRLTCFGCGKLKANSLVGFSDSQFQKGRLKRNCLACQRPRSSKVKGMDFFECDCCDEIWSARQKATAAAVHYVKELIPDGNKVGQNPWEWKKKQSMSKECVKEFMKAFYRIMDAKSRTSL